MDNIATLIRKVLGGEDQQSDEFGNIVPGVFTPVLATHSKSFSLIDSIAVGVDRIERNFEPVRKQVEAWQKSEASWSRPSTLLARRTICTSSPSTTSSGLADLELVECLHFCVQGTGPIPQFRATDEAGRVPETRFSKLAGGVSKTFSRSPRLAMVTVFSRP